MAEVVQGKVAHTGSTEVLERLKKLEEIASPGSAVSSAE